MKFSELWLREWVNPSISTDELAKTLTMAGLEVETIDPVAGHFDKTVVGQVKHIEPHPDADKLNVCQVDVGEKQFLQIFLSFSDSFVLQEGQNRGRKKSKYGLRLKILLPPILFWFY